MKNLILFLALFILAFSAIAQNNTTVTVGADVIGLSDAVTIGGGTTPGLSIGIESAFSKRFTMSADGTFGSKKLFGANSLKVQQKVTAVRTGLKFYPNAANQGFFVGLNLAYTDLKFKLKDGKGDSQNQLFGNTASYLGGGLDLGFKTKITQKISFSTYAGLNLMARLNGYNDAALQYNFGTKIGYRF